MRKYTIGNQLVGNEGDVAAMVEQLRMPWMERIRTLFKFKGFQDAQKEHVIDIIDNSRIYFSEPGSFNDPFDYAPVVRLAGETNDPEFVDEMLREETRYLEARGMSKLQTLPQRTWNRHSATRQRVNDND